MRNRITSIILMGFFALTINAQTQYTKADSIKIVNWLNEAKTLPDNTNLMIHFANKFTNVPYVAHTLEVNDRERLIINLRQLDCTTYVENVLTFSLCAARHLYRFSDFCEMLKQVRYIRGLIGYTSRQHYFTVWIEDNTSDGFVKEVQEPNPPFKNVQKVSVGYMSSHVDAYKMLKNHREWLPYIKTQEQAINGKEYRYIPKSVVGNNELMKKAVKSGDIIAIVTQMNGLDIAHVGIAVWHQDGLHMINASMLHKIVIDEPKTLYQYLQNHKSHLGIRILRPQL